MLAATLLARADGEIHRMNDLQWARTHWASHDALAQNSSNSYDAPATGIDNSIPPIDMSQWSKQRIDDYHRSMQARTDPPVAILQMSSVKLEVPVYADTKELHLNRGAGVVEGTALPGKGGNLAIAGHRDGFFRALRNVRVGDEVEITTSQALYRYRVVSIDIVASNDTRLLADTEESSITLVTCYPFFFLGHAPQRFVVRGVRARSNAGDNANGEVFLANGET